MSDPVEGLHKRHPTEHIAKLNSSTAARPYVHTIERDQNERYQVYLANGQLQVFDLEGNAKSVSAPNGLGYLACQYARDELRVMTIEDYTFIVNRNIYPALQTTPYTETDVVSLTVNFGSGVVNEVSSADIDGGRWVAHYQIPPNFNTNHTANPYGWHNGGPNSTFLNAVQGFNDMMSVYGNPSYITTDDWSFHDVGGYPESVSTGGAVGTATTPPYDDAYPTLLARYKGPVSFTESDGNVYSTPVFLTYYRMQSSTGVAGPQTLQALYPDVGWPGRYHIPGGLTKYHQAGITDGTVYVQVNGTLFSTVAMPNWTAEDYCSYFAGQIAGAFPSLTVSYDSGWQLVIQAPAGQQVQVSAWDSNHEGYVNCVYSELPTQEAVFVVIKSGVQSTTYSVSLNGKLYQYTSGDSNSPNTYLVDTIANQLAAAINTNAADGFEAAAYGSFIRVIRPDKATMTFASHDTWGDQAMYAMKNRVQAFTDLPAKFLPGFPIEVVGTDGAESFYVQYTQEGAQPLKAYGLDNQVTVTRTLSLIKPAANTWNAQEGSESGLWEECAKPGVPNKLIAATMPHVLIRNADGSFTFKEVDWFQRVCGDDDSIPAPSFVGKKIVDLFFHRNRLGFLTESTVVFSRSGQFFNFWAQSARSVLDSDPIDVQVNGTKVATLRATAVFNNQLLLFSDNTQFVISAQNLLTPSTITIMPSTEFDYSYKAKPVTIGHTVMFPSERDLWSSIWEYKVQYYTQANSAENLAAHVPKYLPVDIWKLAACNSIDMLVMATDKEPNNLYVFKYIEDPTASQKVQESWSRWTLDGTIVGIEFVQSSLIVTLQRADGVYMEQLRIENGIEDDPGFLVHLDRKVRLSGGNYTLPYPVDASMTAVRADTGLAVPFSITGTNTVAIAGNPDVYFGQTYSMLYRFSPVYMRDAQSNTAVLDSTVTLRTWSVQYENTADFRLEITPEARSTKVFQFSPDRTKRIGFLPGAVKPATGSFRVPVLGEGKTTTIELHNDSHLPCYVQSAVWEGNYVLRTRRV